VDLMTRLFNHHLGPVLIQLSGVERGARPAESFGENYKRLQEIDVAIKDWLTPSTSNTSLHSNAIFLSDK
jgi:hypothetical protein